MSDLVFLNGTTIDGTGAPRRAAEVHVRADTITAVGEAAVAPQATVIDAGGFVVAPGFVDMHTHSDVQLLRDPSWMLKLAQGVTLEVVGHDGLGVAPVSDETEPPLRAQLRGWNGDDGAWPWRTITEYLSRFDRRVAPNVAMLAPHGTIRLLVLGDADREPTAPELERMIRVLHDAVAAGCVGLSAGLTYVPGMYATDDELVALCRPFAKTSFFYCPHHRNYGSEALQGYADSIAIGRRAGVPVHLTHAHLGFSVNRGRADELVTLVDQARGRGEDVTLDSYPYLAGNSYLHALLPGWAQEGGTAAMRRRLCDPVARARIRYEMEELGSEGFHGVPIDWSTIVPTDGTTERMRQLVGRTIVDGAAMVGADSPFALFCDTLLAEDFAVGALSFVGNEENVRTIMRHPAHMASSDGIVVGAKPHPRAWGSHARYLAHYVRELGLLSLEEMVRKMTSLPARRLGLVNRGVLRPGAAADIVCFDPDRIQDQATYEEPKRLATGVVHVIVNGELVIRDGEPTGALPGRVLRPSSEVACAA